jgi:hypothetical protein
MITLLVQSPGTALTVDLLLFVVLVLDSSKEDGSFVRE